MNQKQPKEQIPTASVQKQPKEQTPTASEEVHKVEATALQHEINKTTVIVGMVGVYGMALTL